MTFNCFISVSFFGDKLNMLNTIGCCVVLAGVIFYKFIHYLEKRHAEGELIAVPTYDKDNRSEDGRDPLRMEMYASKPDSGEDLNKFLDESSGRYTDEPGGIEMRRPKPLRSRGEHVNGSAQELLVV
jgi:hypothetical protein